MLGGNLECAVLQQVVADYHISLAGSVFRAEAGGADGARDKSDRSVLRLDESPERMGGESVAYQILTYDIVLYLLKENQELKIQLQNLGMNNNYILTLQQELNQLKKLLMKIM